VSQQRSGGDANFGLLVRCQMIRATPDRLWWAGRFQHLAGCGVDQRPGQKLDATPVTQSALAAACVQRETGLAQEFAEQAVRLARVDRERPRALRVMDDKRRG